MGRRRADGLTRGRGAGSKSCSRGRLRRRLGGRRCAGPRDTAPGINSLGGAGPKSSSNWAKVTTTPLRSTWTDRHVG